MKIQLRRITEATRAALTTAPSLGEPIYCTDSGMLYFGNGSTLTGVPLKLDWTNLSNVPGYVDDVLEYANVAAFPTTGSSGLVYVALDTNKVYRWSGSTYVGLSSAGVADNAIKLQTARTISLTGSVSGSVSFDGSADVSIVVSTTTLAPKASPAFTGVPTAPTATVGTNSTQLATTAFVKAEIAAQTTATTTAPGLMSSTDKSKLDGLSQTNVVNVLTSTSTTDALSAAQGKALNDALVLKAPLASPALTGVPTAPTAAAGTNTTQIASTAFVAAAITAMLNTLVIDGGTT